MSDYASLGGGLVKSPPYAVSPIAAASLPAGTPVYLNGSGQAAAAEGNAIGTANAIGVLGTVSVAGQAADVRWGGSLTLDDAQWALVLAGAPAGGLTVGANYFVSELAPGTLTTRKPTGGTNFITYVGVAESATSLYLKVGPPIAVGSA